MGTEELSSKLGIDTTDFKTAISEINRELRVVESGFRAGASALGDWGASASGLEMRIQALTSKMDLQRAKVSALQGEYERVAEAKGKDSAAAQELEIKLNKANETLNEMDNELQASEQALAEMGTESTETAGDVDTLATSETDATTKTIDLGEAARTAGTVIKAAFTAVIAVVTALVTAIAGLAVGIGSLVFKTAEAADELVDMSLKTSISTTRLQELQYVGDQVGVSLDTISTSLARLTRSMSDAQGGSEAAAAAFDALGVSVTNQDGSLRDSEAVFYDVIDALGAIENPTERDALAMGIFGRSARELNPLIATGAEEIANLSAEAHAMGAVMSEEAVAAMGEFADTWDGLKGGIKGTLGTLAGAFLPAFQGMADSAMAFLAQAQPAFEQIGLGLANILTGLGNTGELGSGIAMIGEMLGMTADDATAMGDSMSTAILGMRDWVVNSLIPALSSLWTWLTIDLPAGIATLSDYWTNTLQPAMQTVWTWVSANLIPVLQTIWSWISQYLVASLQYWSTLWTTVLLPALSTVWAWITANLLPLLSQLWAWLGVNVPIAIQTLSTFWQTVLLPAIQAVWTWISTNLLPLLSSLWGWLATNIPLALQTLSAFWTTILLPAITAVWDWISVSLLPLLSSLWGWLATTIPLALQTLSDFWTATLLPAITAVWDWISVNLIPLFTALWDLLSTAGELALTILAGLWQNILLPAITAVADYIGTSFQPAWDGLMTFFNESVVPVIEAVAGVTLPLLTGAFDAISTAIGIVIGWINSMTEKLAAITLPAWLTPGSPTPFEMGLRGIASAMDELSRSSLPNMALELNRVGNASMGTIGAGQAAAGRAGAITKMEVTINVVGGTGQEREQAYIGFQAAARSMGLA